MSEVVAPRHIQLTEWSSCGPEHPALKGGSLAALGLSPATANALSEWRPLRVRELRKGLELTTNSFVGRVRLGVLEVSVVPKIPKLPLLRLLRYAYGLRDLTLQDAAGFEEGDCGWQDLLMEQLLAEVDELLVRGLSRRYRERSLELSVPRGRIDLVEVARRGPFPPPTLPCAVHDRRVNALENRVLLSGLLLVARGASDPSARARAAHWASRLGAELRPEPLSAEVFERLERQRDRQIEAYRSAHTIVRLLHQARGPVLEGSGGLELPGFLFDMNRFFQALLSRFLHEHLPAAWSLVDEHRLRGVFRYATGKNPKGLNAPTPRPDFAVVRGGRVHALLDAKYRDLWATRLPRDMLYQTAVYALSGSNSRACTVLYPTLAAEAREATIEVKGPWSGETLGAVHLRPVDMERLAKIVEEGARREGAQWAKELTGVASEVGRAGLSVGAPSLYTGQLMKSRT